MLDGLQKRSGRGEEESVRMRVERNAYNSSAARS
jgi:hypothetical protein